MGDFQYVEVNGAQIEREYFQASVNEARLCKWVPSTVTTDRNDHHHCIICDVAIAEREGYICGNRWLCPYCYSRFVKRSD